MVKIGFRIVVGVTLLAVVLLAGTVQALDDTSAVRVCRAEHMCGPPFIVPPIDPPCSILDVINPGLPPCAAPE